MDKAIKVTLGTLFILLFTQCNNDRIYEEYQEIKEIGWNVGDSLLFKFPNSEQMNSGTPLIGIRFNEKYPYSNCYIQLTLKDSLDRVLDKKLINVPLFNSKTGKPLGKGFGGSYTQLDTIPIQFPSGTNSVTLSPAMREEVLQGIESVGIKVSR